MSELVEGFMLVLDSWGVCAICDGEHAWANVKCDLLDEPAPKLGE